ncbi:hypothetical protein HKD37_04G011404 [Glycine soja]
MDSLSVYAQADANLTEEEKFTNASSIFSMDMQTRLRGSDGSRLYASYPINLICILSFYVPGGLFLKGTRQWSWRVGHVAAPGGLARSWRVAVHVAGPATLRVAGPATWTATRQLHWRVPQAPPRVQLANSTGESLSETDPLEKVSKQPPFGN